MSKDRGAYQEMVGLTHSNAVPQIYIDGEMVIGFNEKVLQEKLGITAIQP